MVASFASGEQTEPMRQRHKVGCGDLDRLSPRIVIPTNLVSAPTNDLAQIGLVYQTMTVL